MGKGWGWVGVGVGDACRRGGQRRPTPEPFCLCAAVFPRDSALPPPHRTSAGLLPSVEKQPAPMPPRSAPTGDSLEPSAVTVSCHSHRGGRQGQ